MNHINILRIGVYKIIYVDDGDRDEKSVEDFRKLAIRSIVFVNQLG